MSRITIRRPGVPSHTKLLVYQDDKLVGTIHRHTPADIRLCPNVEAAWSVNWISGRVDFGDTLREVRDTALKGPPAMTKTAAPALDPKLTHRIVCDSGQWAKGATEAEARDTFKRLHSSRKIPNALVYAVTPESYINDAGSLVRPKGDPAPVLISK